MSNVIHFYSQDGENGFLSNFYESKVIINEKTYPSSEHAFQAQKFLGSKSTQFDLEYAESIRTARNPKKAKALGRSRKGKQKLRSDWEKVKVEIMREIVFAKFTQSEKLQKKLLNTGNKRLVEHINRDMFWADGGNGTGKNWLGRILMEARESLRQQIDQENENK
ncbi:hypothetical protein M0813_14802 [Anaeramoeba flamelloides]|uniref:NADAR domain-containing protein n=1 Tax=Anaeramoeba flamelloides TaxID=1746091 RepID=A0AAV7Z881_9EUKA|nr:hypothetical protein M0812_19039 [Anaeramoeba flamelloides]KAJ6251604.1 hypothetical protein M0813_14802 [Anaeramoeba flamelloides]|eukprot:Anaeramoba_flamelloidesa332647_31.p1 GENE.a332647_31~~a332647_31.p1  ORF type:complete len:165 (-),score=32.31 a332647_31:162-656(-)